MSTEKQKVEELLKQMEQGTKEVFESEKYKQYLKTMSKFHNYSYGNVMLIMLQCPQATHVAGYVSWQKNFNRQVVRPGAIKILAYAPKTIEVQVEVKDQNGQQILDTDGCPKTEKQKRIIPSFKPVNVFDISATEGEPLPSLIDELQGDVKYYDYLWEAINICSPFAIEFEKIAGGAKGYCSSATKRIAINEGMSQVQTIKTAIHEMAHAELHTSSATDVKKLTRDTKEVQAESVAFIVCQHYGIDTSEYSFTYVAGWSGTQELKQLYESLATIQKEASSLITRIDEQMLLLHNPEETTVNEETGGEETFELSM